MKPRSSTTVLARVYGDCKDKANLMRALLKALKIENSGGGTIAGRASEKVNRQS